MKLSRLLFFTLILWCAQSFSDFQKIKITCATEPLSTSFLFEQLSPTDGRLMVIHHNGVKYAPLIKGTVTSADLEILRDQFEDYKLMGDSFKVQFSIESCRFDENKDMACFYKNSAQIGNLKVKDYYFSVHRETNKSRYGEFELHQVRFEYRVGSSRRSIQMEYYGDSCRWG